MIKVILWDIDGTLLNFEAAEKAAIRHCFSKHGLGECTDEMLLRYTKINKKYWERLERGELTKPEVLIGRFEEFFAAEGLPVEKAEAVNSDYQISLGDTICFNDDGYELVKSLKDKVKQYAVTNGTLIAQERKLRKSGLDQLLEEAFISDVIGIEKPGIGFFEHVFDKIGTYEKDEVLIVGDSLTSDMQGGNNAGILCCWYNPQNNPRKDGIRIDYEIQNLQEVLTILNQNEQ